MNKPNFRLITGMRLLVMVMSLLLLFLPSVVVIAQSLDSTHHLQHTEVIACSAACVTSAPRVEDKSAPSIRVESTQSGQDEELTEVDAPGQELRDELFSPHENYLPDKVKTFKSIAVYLL